MPAHESLLERLRSNNPFASDNVADPWEDAYPSVTAIHARPFHELQDLVNLKAKNPSLATGALILGEAGSGKTHLVKRVVGYEQDAAAREREQLLVAYVQPIEATQLPFSYLLHEIMGSLRRPMARTSNSPSQLDSLLSRWLLERLGGHIAAISPAIAARVTNKPDRILSLNLTGLVDLDVILTQNLPRPLRNVLPNYCWKDRRQAVMDWLAGEILDPEVLEVLGLLDRRSRFDTSAEEREAEALELLLALWELLSDQRYCLLVCFDRWENLEAPAQLNATGRMVGELFDRIKGMLPIVLVRAMAWDEQVSTSLNQHIVDRISNNKLFLRTCDKAEAMELITSRLAFALGEMADGIAPFTQANLDRFLAHGGLSPRAIIKLTNEHLKDLLYSTPDATAEQADPADPTDTLAEEFAMRQKNAIAENLAQYAPDRGRLRRALLVLLQQVPGVRLDDPKLGDRDKIDLLLLVQAASVGNEQVVAFIIDLEQYHGSVRAALDRGLQHLKGGVSNKVVYIRDGRHPIPPRPRWTKTNDRREQLEQEGALLWTLDTKQAASWYALADLAYAVKAEDVTLAQGGRLRIVSPQELSTWAAKDLRSHPAFLPLWQFIDQLAAGDNDKTSMPNPNAPETKLTAATTSKLLEICVSILKVVPSRLMPGRLLCEHLAKQGHAIELPPLLELLGSYQDRFDLFPSRDEIMILLNAEWLNAQSQR